MSKYDYPFQVTILKVQGSYQSNWPPENLQEFVNWAENRLREVPEEYRSSAKIEFDSYTEYDSSVQTMEIYYDRPPTEGEIQKRKAEDEAYIKRQYEWAEQNYKRLLNQIKIENE